MTVYIAAANGNLTDAATWQAVDSTSYANSESTYATLPTSKGSSARSSTFTPGAITLDGIAVKLDFKSSSPSGTISVNLWDSTNALDVTGTTVTLNVSDLPNVYTGTAHEGGWIFFKFTSPVTLVAATNYAVQAITSVSNQVQLFVNSGTNWSRCLRTTTTGAPAAGDDLIITGEWTGAGACTSRSVTMDSTSATDYGNNSTGNSVTPALAICKNGTLTYGVAESTNYTFRLSGNARVYYGGTLIQGSSGAPTPITSTAVLEFDNIADGGMGLSILNGGTWNFYGSPRTAGKNVTSCLLSANAAANATSLTVDTDTGWKSGDTIAIASTTRTVGQMEIGTLSADAGSSTLSITGFGGSGGGLAYAHGGVDPVQAEVILLTHNVKVRSVSSSNYAYINIAAGATVSGSWLEGYYLGASSVYGVDVRSPISISYSSLHDYKNICLNLLDAATSNSSTINHLNFCKCNGSFGSGLYLDISATGLYSITYCVSMSGASGSNGFSVNNQAAITFSNNKAASNNSIGMSFSGRWVSGSSISDNVSHSNGSYGVSLNCSSGYAVKNPNLVNLKSYRNSADGVRFLVSVFGNLGSGWSLFGNTGSNIYNAAYSKASLSNLSSSGDTSFSTSHGIRVDPSNVLLDLEINDSTLSLVSGILTAHTEDIYMPTVNTYGKLTFRNSSFGALTLVGNVSYLDTSTQAYVASQNHNKTSGNYLAVLGMGTLSRDTSIFKTASPSLKMTPTSASVKLPSAPSNMGMLAACVSGDTVTVSVSVRKSVVGDGAAYNGSQPRLICRYNPEMGVTSDTVLATASGAAGSWETLTGVTSAAASDGMFEFIVDVDGTTGFVNLDDWTVV